MVDSAAPALAVPAPRQQPRGNAARAWRNCAATGRRSSGLVIVAILVFTAIFAPFLAPYNPYTVALDQRLQPPGGAHLLGTDELGRDILSRLIYGARVALWVGIVTVVLAGATRRQRRTGRRATWAATGMRSSCAWSTCSWRFRSSFWRSPSWPFAGPGLTNVLIALALVYWTSYARVSRGTVLLLREEEYTWAARTLGASPTRIMVRHLLPNAIAPLVVLASLGMGNAILAEAALSFLGLGIQPPEASWGSMLNFGMQFLRDASFLSTFPGLAIFVTVLGFNLLGDGLRDALDPRMRT